ncbi:hypothetical protein BGX21_004723, partial [Mortierella sp. AD011]
MSSSRQPLLGQHNGTPSSSLKFGFTKEQLAPLTDPTNPTLPRQLGGIREICKGLLVDPDYGLHSDESSDSLGHSDQHKFAARSEHFGRN